MLFKVLLIAAATALPTATDAYTKPATDVYAKPVEEPKAAAVAEPCTTTAAAYVAPEPTAAAVEPVADVYTKEIEVKKPEVVAPEEIDCEEEDVLPTGVAPAPTGAYSDVEALAEQYQETELPGYDISGAKGFTVGFLGLLALAL